MKRFLIRKKGGSALTRLSLPVFLGYTMWLIGWQTLTWQVGAQTSSTALLVNCPPKIVLSKPLTPTHLIISPLVYTLTNQATCTDTFSIETTTLSNNLYIDYWTPITIELTSGQSIPIFIHIPVIADVGNITDTLVITASSQMSDSIKVVLSDQVIMLGSVLPTPRPLYLPFVIKT